MHALDLFTRVRDDLLASAANQKWTDAQVYRYLNRAYRKVWGEQTTLFESWGLKRSTIDLVASTEMYSLPADCKKIVLIEYLYNGVYYPIKDVPYQDTYQFSAALVNPYTIEINSKRYYELGAQIGVVPTPSSSLVAGIRVTYYPSSGGIHAGTVAAVTGSGPSTAITLATGASDDDDAYNDQYVSITSGTGAGQKAQITDYVGATKVATVTFATAPTTASAYAIWPKTEKEMDELIIIQADRDLLLVQDPAAARLFADVYNIERKRRVEEMEQRNLEPRMVRYIDPDR